jgi:hypothetical protein
MGNFRIGSRNWPVFDRASPSRSTASITRRLGPIWLLVWMLPIAFIFFLAISPVPKTVAQNPVSERGKEEPGVDAYNSPFGLLNNVGLRVDGPNGRYGELFFEIDTLTHGTRLAELNCLMHEEIQSALELTDDQLKELQPVFEQATEFIWRDRWFRFGWCEPVKEAARKRISALSKKLGEEDFVRQVLLPHQYQRLLQIERRFLFNVLASLPPVYSEQFYKQLKMDREQARAFGAALSDSAREIREENAKWEVDVFFPMLQKMFTGDIQNEVDSVIKDAALFSDNPVVRFGQMSDLFRFSEIERLPGKASTNDGSSGPADLSFTNYGPVIVINGRFAEWQDFRHRDCHFMQRTRWKNFLERMNLFDDSWLELSPEQRDAFAELHWFESTPDQMLRSHFYGDDRLRPYEQKRTQGSGTDEKEYIAWENEFRELNAQIDAEIGDRIQAILLPFQRDRLQFALGANQFPQLGIWHTLRNKMLGGRFALTREQLAELEKEITHRRKQELERYIKFESEMLDSLTIEQREAFIDVFGEPVSYMPTMLFAFVDGVKPK